MKEKSWLIIASVLGFLCVAIGAFAAHALETRLAPKFLEIMDTGLRYQMFACGSLFILVIVQRVFKLDFAFPLAFQFIGCVLFSFSLYIYALTEFKPLVFLTPIGGTFFLVSWVMAIIKIYKADLCETK